MRRYFFDMHRENVVATDWEGELFRDETHAKTEARLSVQECVGNLISEGKGLEAGKLVLRDESRVIEEIPFKDALSSKL